MNEPIQIGVLAFQGDFDLHIQALDREGARSRKVRVPEDLQGLGGIIIPGGESTTMVKLAKASGLFDELRRKGAEGLPMFGTCAGAILLGQGNADPERLGLVPVGVRRNAYGRQRESFKKALPMEMGGEKFLCIFIRAPRIEPFVDPRIEVLAWDGADPILIRWKNFLLATFHPELTKDPRIHKLFLEMCRGRAGAAPSRGP